MTGLDASLRAYYAARAPEYDRVYEKPERQADQQAIRRWLPPLFAGARVLEIACGTGYWTQFIAPAAAQVLAIDAAPETLAVARGRGWPRHVEFVVGDAYALGVMSDSFDAAFAGFWFSHVPKRRRREFLAGLHARLTRGARVVLLDNLYVEGSSTPIAGRDADGDSWQRRTLADGSSYDVLKNFPSEAELRELIGASGERAAVVRWQHYWALDYIVR